MPDFVFTDDLLKNAFEVSFHGGIDLKIPRNFVKLIEGAFGTDSWIYRPRPLDKRNFELKPCSRYDSETKDGKWFRSY